MDIHTIHILGSVVNVAVIGRRARGLRMSQGLLLKGVLVQALPIEVSPHDNGNYYFPLTSVQWVLQKPTKCLFGGRRKKPKNCWIVAFSSSHSSNRWYLA